LDEHHPEWGLAQMTCFWLGCLPLALELSAAYLETYPEVTLAGYVERLRTEGRLLTIDDTELRPEDLPDKAQRYLEVGGRTDLISYEGERTDLFGHSYFTTNPQVSTDLIQLIRYGRRLGEPGRELTKTGRVTWQFPTAAQ
jgi:hypothetical protein